MKQRDKETFPTGAQRSVRVNRFDLIPAALMRRLAKRFTGEIDDNGEPTGGALKYGEGNWEKGLPTSDVINHIFEHLINYQERFRIELTKAIHEGRTGENLMLAVRTEMNRHSRQDDDLAGAVWGLSVLMRQEETEMYHDDKFYLAEPVKTKKKR